MSTAVRLQPKWHRMPNGYNSGAYRIRRHLPGLRGDVRTWTAWCMGTKITGPLHNGHFARLVDAKAACEAHAAAQLN